MVLFKRHLTTALAGLCVAGNGLCATDLMISEYIEGSSNNKAVELYNGTDQAIDLAAYELAVYFNCRKCIAHLCVLRGAAFRGSVAPENGEGGRASATSFSVLRSNASPKRCSPKHAEVSDALPAVEIHGQFVGCQVDGLVSPVIQFHRFVVAGTFYVFGNHQIRCTQPVTGHAQSRQRRGQMAFKQNHGVHPVVDFGMNLEVFALRMNRK